MGYIQTSNTNNWKKTMWINDPLMHCNLCTTILPLTFSSAENCALPAGFEAWHMYIPLCLAFTLLNKRMDNFESISFIKKSDDEWSDKLSLYHWIVIGSSPMVTAHEIWISCPSSTSSGKTNGKMSGSADGE